MGAGACGPVLGPLPRAGGGRGCSAAPPAPRRGAAPGRGAPLPVPLPAGPPHPREPAAGQARPDPARGGGTVPGGGCRQGRRLAGSSRGRGAAAGLADGCVPDGGVLGGGWGTPETPPPAQWSGWCGAAEACPGGTPSPGGTLSPSRARGAGEGEAPGRGAGDRGLSLGTGQACRRRKVVQSYSPGAGEGPQQATGIYFISSPPRFPPVASRLRAPWPRGGAGSPLAVSISFPSQNVSCSPGSLRRLLGPDVWAALPPSPPRNPLGPPKESLFPTRKPFPNCLGLPSLG